MPKSTFAQLLTKYMRRIRASSNDVAKEIGVNRLTIINWKKDSMPGKKNRDKVVACAKYLRLTDEETNDFLKAASFLEEYVLTGDLAEAIFVDYIQRLFIKLSQLNPYPVMLLLTQANWDEPPCRNAILARAKQIYLPENVLHIHPPVSLTVDSDSYFAHLGKQCEMECVKNDYDFENVLKNRVEKTNKTNPLFLLVSRFEQGVPSLGKHLANIIRDISETYPNRFHVMLCGGEQLAALKYQNGSLSLLNFAKDEHWPELGIAEVKEWCNHRFKEVQLNEDLVNKLLKVSGGHPQLLNKCFALQLDYPLLDVMRNYPEKLSQSDELWQLFMPFRTKDQEIRQQVCQCLGKQGKLANWQPYILDEVLRELYWKNLLVWRDDELHWRCEAMRMAGKEILECNQQ